MWLVQSLVILPWLGAGAIGFRRGVATVLSSFLLNAFFGILLGLADETLLRGLTLRSIDPTSAGRARR